MPPCSLPPRSGRGLQSLQAALSAVARVIQQAERSTRGFGRPAAPAADRERNLSRALDGGLLAALGLAALLVRLPNLQLIPAFTDETDDVYRAFLAARGQLLPLTDTSYYIGSLWDWSMAAALRLSSYSLFAPRALVAALGVL